MVVLADRQPGMSPNNSKASEAFVQMDCANGRSGTTPTTMMLKDAYLSFQGLHRERHVLIQQLLI